MTRLRMLLARVTAGTKNEKGATTVEYALLVSLIAGAVILAATNLGTKLSDILVAVTAALP